MLEPSSEQLVRSKFLLNPVPELAARSKVLLGPASTQLVHSKMLLKPPWDVAGLSKGLPEQASGQLVRSKLLLKRAAVQAERYPVNLQEENAQHSFLLFTISAPRLRIFIGLLPCHPLPYHPDFKKCLDIFQYISTDFRIFPDIRYFRSFKNCL